MKLLCLFALGLILVHTPSFGADAKDPPPPSPPADPANPFGSDRARAEIATFKTRGALGDSSIPPRSPAETVASFKLMEGLKAEAVLHEPLVTHPLHLSFDERGRL